MAIAHVGGGGCNALGGGSRGTVNTSLRVGTAIQTDSVGYIGVGLGRGRTHPDLPGSEFAATLNVTLSFEPNAISEGFGRGDSRCLGRIVDSGEPRWRWRKPNLVNYLCPSLRLPLFMVEWRSDVST